MLVGEPLEEASHGLAHRLIQRHLDDLVVALEEAKRSTQVVNHVCQADNLLGLHLLLLVDLLVSGHVLEREQYKPRTLFALQMDACRRDLQ